MAFTYGFYDSVNHDRVYNAEQFSSIFDGILADGVFKACQIEGSIDNNDQFNVYPGGGRMVFVGRGRAWFNDTWNYNNIRIGLTISSSHGIFDRYDAVILEVNKNTRQNSVKVLTGISSSTPEKPELIKTGGVFQYALAYVLVPAGSTEISQGDIQNVVGTDETPYCRCMADDIEMHIYNGLDQTMPGYALDARQGKALNDKVNSKIDTSMIYNGLDQEYGGYVLDARQGKVLYETTSGKLADTDIHDGLDIIQPNLYALDARQGRILNNRLDTLTTKVNGFDSSINAASNKASEINGKLTSGSKNFQFGVDSNGNYGYVKNIGGADTVVPFNRDDAWSERYFLGRNFATFDCRVSFPKFYKRLTVYDFDVHIDSISFTPGYTTSGSYYPQGNDIWSKANLSSNGLSITPQIEYSPETGALSINYMDSSIRASYKLYNGTSTTVDESYVDWSGFLYLTVDYSVYLKVKLISPDELDE